MELGFQAGCIIREDHRVDVKRERHAGTAQLVDTVHRFQAASHADFKDILAKRTNVADDINITGLAVLEVDDFLTLLCDGSQLTLELFNTFFQQAGLFIILRLFQLLRQLADLIVILALFFLDLLTLALQFFPLFCFLPHLLTDSTLLFLGPLFLDIVFILDFDSLLEEIIKLPDEPLDRRCNALIPLGGDGVVFRGDRLDIVQRIVQSAEADIVQHVLELSRKGHDHQAINGNVCLGGITIFIFFKCFLNVFLIFTVALAQRPHIEALKRKRNSGLHQLIGFFQELFELVIGIPNGKCIRSVLNGPDQFFTSLYLLCCIGGALLELFIFLCDIGKLSFSLDDFFFQLEALGAQACVFFFCFCNSILFCFRRNFLKQCFLICKPF